MERGDTSTRPLPSSGVGTRRPSLVILTATWRRSLPSKWPNVASVAPAPPESSGESAVYQHIGDRQPKRAVALLAGQRGWRCSPLSRLT